MNAFDLFNDAYLLFQFGRLPRAYTLFQLSSEEVGKVVLLLEVFGHVQIYENIPEIREKKDMDKLFKQMQKIFSNHQEKMKYIITFELNNWKQWFRIINSNIKDGASYQEVELQKDLKMIEELNELKNNSLYTSVIQDKFIHPSKIIDVKKVNTIMYKAFSKCSLIRSKSIRFLKERKIPEEINIDNLEKMPLLHQGNFYELFWKPVKEQLTAV
jgi:AbiV family abortive infection protein